MAIILNNDKENYFVVANEPYNIIGNNQVLFSVYRGQYFKWSSKNIPENTGCSSCNKKKGYYTLTGYSNCDKGFKDENGNEIFYAIPDYILEETYDTEDEDGVCESWFEETGGYNKDVFTPPHLRTKEYDDWNAEKNTTG